MQGLVGHLADPDGGELHGVGDVLAGEPAPEDAQHGNRGDGDKGTDDAADFAAGEHAEDGGEGRHFKLAAHDSGGVDVILGDAPGAEREEEPADVIVAEQDGETPDEGGGDGGAKEGDELAEAGDRGRG